jgi:hypothetical protein
VKGAGSVSCKPARSARGGPLGAAAASGARSTPGDLLGAAAARRARSTPGDVLGAAAVRRSPSVSGQASVELVALLPLAALTALAIGQLLAAGSARELAGNAAEAGAAALLQGSDPAAAARDALPGWSRERTVVHVSGRRVEVHVRPRTVVPVLAGRLEATATADAGAP